MVRDKPAHGSTIPADVTDELSEYTGAFLYGKIYRGENQRTKIHIGEVVYSCKTV